MIELSKMAPRNTRNLLWPHPATVGKVISAATNNALEDLAAAVLPLIGTRLQTGDDDATGLS